MIKMNTIICSKPGSFRIVGEIISWPGSNLPEGYQLCDGVTLQIAEYPELFEIIGMTYSPEPFVYTHYRLQWLRRMLHLPLYRCDYNPEALPQGMFRLPLLTPRVLPNAAE